MQQKEFPRPFIGGYPGHFNAKFLKNEVAQNPISIGIPQAKPNVISGHLRFDKAALQLLMPIGTKYITILREPSAVFRSTFSYYYGKPDRFFLERQNISQHSKFIANCFHSPYIDILEKINGTFSEYLKIVSSKLNPEVPWYFRSMNHQAHDLGLDPMKMDDKYIEEQIRHLDSSFNLVMIAEHFNESLVLLKDELCMDRSNIKLKVLNRGSYEAYNYTDQEETIIRNLNKLDFALYSHFNRTLWRKIEAYGKEKMKNDIKRITSTPTKQKKDKHAQQLKTVNEMKYLNENLLLYRMANTEKRLAERILNNKHELFSSQNGKIEQLAKYMMDNSGGCNF